MNLEQRLRESLVAPDPGAVFTARVMARMTRGRARRGRRFIVMGALLVAGVAAAMLAWQMSGLRSTQQSTEIATIPTVSESAPAVAEQTAQAPTVADGSLAPSSIPESTLPASPHYTVQVTPLRLEAQDVAGREQVEAFYSSIVEEMRKVPGIALQGPGGSADYVLTITKLGGRNTDVVTVDGRGAVSASSQANIVDLNIVPSNLLQRMDVVTGGASATYGSGAAAGVVNLALNNRLSGVNMDYRSDPLTGRMSRGETSIFEAGGSGSPGSIMWIEMRVEPRGESAFRYTFPIGVEGFSAQIQCAAPDARLKAECLTPAQLAARQLEKLRMQVFPSDTAIQLRIVERLVAPGLTQDQQIQMLHDLLAMNIAPDDAGQQGRTTRLDVATLRALTRHMATLTALARVQIWSMLRGVSQPELISPLVHSLRHDTDRQVRLEALATLKASFATEPAFKAALESAAQKDPDELVRIAARRELYGPAQWRSDVLAIVDNSNLPYEGRLAPLRERTSELSGQNLELMRDRQVLRKVVDLVRENMGDSDHSRATFEMLVLLSNVNDPLVTDLFAEARRKGIQTPPSVFGSGAVRRVDPSRTGEAQVDVDYSALPSNLRDRVQQVIEGAKPPSGQ